jgi:hypothetical protein
MIPPLSEIIRKMKEQTPAPTFSQKQMIDFANWSIKQARCGVADSSDLLMFLKETIHKEEIREIVLMALRDHDACLHGFDKWFENDFYPRLTFAH